MKPSILCCHIPEDIRLQLRISSPRFYDLCQFSNEISTSADVLLIPAEQFLDINSALPFNKIIAFGPASLLESSFVAGADDYIKDPWEAHELIIRSGINMHAVILQCGSLEMMHDGRDLFINSIYLPLSPCKSKLMRILMDHPNSFLSPKSLIRYLRIHSETPVKSLHVQVHGLRKKLETGMKGFYGKDLAIENSRSSGYRLKLPCG